MLVTRLHSCSRFAGQYGSGEVAKDPQRILFEVIRVCCRAGKAPEWQRTEGAPLSQWRPRKSPWYRRLCRRSRDGLLLFVFWSPEGGLGLPTLTRRTAERAVMTEHLR